MIDATKSAARLERGTVARGTVARGRTVMVQSTTEKRRGVNANGDDVMVPLLVAKGPGEIIELAADEISRLTSSGFLIDPNRPALPVADNPAMNKIVGPQQFGARESGPIGFSFRS